MKAPTWSGFEEWASIFQRRGKGVPGRKQEPGRFRPWSSGSRGSGNYGLEGGRPQAVPQALACKWSFLAWGIGSGMARGNSEHSSPLSGHRGPGRPEDGSGPCG